MQAFVLFLAITLVASATNCPDLSAGSLPPIRIILVGDSTVAVGSGYGPGFCAVMAPEVTCLDMAKGGRSTKSYRDEGSWEEVLRVLSEKGEYRSTYVLIQFGHNDQPNKPGRSTDLATEFPANLRRFVQEARSAGGTPVLVTPLTRRMFRDGKLDDNLGPWAQATRDSAVAASVSLLDLYGKSSSAVQDLGPEEANTLAMAPPSPAYAESARAGTSKQLSPKLPSAPGMEPKGDPGPVFDYTHLGKKGAAFFGSMVARELALPFPQRSLI